MLLAWLAAAWLAGIAASAAMGARAWPLVLALFAVTAGAAIVRRIPMLALAAIVLPAILALAMWREAASHGGLPANSIAQWNDSVAMRLSGVVRDDPERGDTSQRITIDLQQVERRGKWESASGGVLVTAPLYPEYRARYVVEFEARLESPPQLDDFNYAEYLARRGIVSTAVYPRMHVTGHDEPMWWNRWPLEVRRKLARGLDLALPEPQSSLARGVLLGQRAALPDDLNDDLNATSTSHLVVVSGGNVVLVAALCGAALTWIAGRRRALWLSIGVVTGYCVLVGLSPPVMRALIMGVLLLVAQASGRRTSAATSIVVAAAVMAGITPSIVRDVSFQLSFAATAGILYLAGPIAKCVESGLAFVAGGAPRWAGTIVQALAMTLAATVSTAPLLMLNFERLSLVGVVANVLVVPAFPLILFASALAAIGGLMPAGHVVFAAPAYYALSYWITVTEWLASLPAASVRVPWIDARLTLLLYAAVALAAIPLVRASRSWSPPERAPRTQAIRWRRAAIVAAPVFVAAVSIGAVVWPSEPRRLEVTVLDVGQGDAILIETPSGHDVLVDGGSGSAVLRGLGREMPWHDRSIDLVVLTHPQADHRDGLVDVLRRYDVRRVLIGGGEGASGTESLFEREAVADAGIVEHAHEGMTVDLGNGVAIDVLSASRGSANVNNDALVLMLRWGDVRFLLTGDIEAEAEARLLSSGADMHATVLKVAHHGSKTSSTSAFLDAVEPEVAAISVGEGNRYGHPNADVVERLAEYGTVVTTAERGDLHFETDGRRLWVRTQR
jgi:competence protein ComEC